MFNNIEDAKDCLFNKLEVQKHMDTLLFYDIQITDLDKADIYSLYIRNDYNNTTEILNIKVQTYLKNICESLNENIRMSLRVAVNPQFAKIYVNKYMLVEKLIFAPMEFF